MMNRYAELAVWHGSCFAIMEQIYKNNLGKGVAFPCLCVAFLSFRCRIGRECAPERGFPDKNVSFLWCFSKISNFRFFIIRSCFYSRVVSLFGPSELPGSPFLGDAKRTKKGGSIFVMLPLYITFVNQFFDSIFRAPSIIAFVKKLYQ